MRTICSIIATIALVFLAAPAVAMEWVYVGKDANNNRLFFDLSTMQRSGKQIAVWERISPERGYTVDPLSSKKIEELRIRNRYDCAAKTVTKLSTSKYFYNKIETRYVPERDRNPSAISAGTASEDFLDTVCQSKFIFEEDWIKFDKSPTGTEIYYHSKTIERPNRLATAPFRVFRVWLKYDHARDKTVKHRETRQRVEYTCGWHPMYKEISESRFYKDGNLFHEDLGHTRDSVYDGRYPKGFGVVRKPMALKILTILCPTDAPPKY